MGRRERDIHTDRLLLGSAAIVSVDEAVRRLPLGDAAARALLHDNELIRCPDGVHKAVVWGDVLAYFQGERRRGGAPAPERSAQVRPPAGRVPLDSSTAPKRR